MGRKLEGQKSRETASARDINVRLSVFHIAMDEVSVGPSNG